MTALNSRTAENIHDLLDYDVVDQAGNAVGTLHSFWADPATGKPEFIGVKTGWIFGQNHVIPADRVEFDDAARTVHVPYDAEFIKGAMSVDADSEINDEEEAEIYRYYNVRARGTSTTTTTAGTTRAADTGAAGYTATPKRTDTPTAATAKTTTDKDTIEVPLTEEQVKVGKRTVDAGQVRLRKIVRTEIVNQPVEVKREDVVVERVPAGEVRSGTGTSDFKEEVIDVPLSREEVVVSKDAQVTGAVRVKKTAETETQQVSEQVRKEDVEVLRDGKTVVSDEPKRR
ncbi:MAG: PRC and DUF2382 domain-containing protein [Rhodospirillales bacterium]|nr:PRC and DUF2382 domain-containing protein [Acetobacter sp.]